MFDHYDIAEYMDVNNITNSVNNITNNKIFETIFNQLHVSENKNQEDKNDCQICFNISLKFKNDSATMILTNSSILNLYNVGFDQIIGAVNLVVSITNRKILFDMMIRNILTYENTTLLDISANHLVVFEKIDIEHYDIAVHNNLNNNCDISMICLAFIKILNHYHYIILINLSNISWHKYNHQTAIFYAILVLQCYTAHTQGLWYLIHDLVALIVFFFLKRLVM